MKRAHGSVGGLPASPACPFCERHETELVNPFGSHASVSTYWCLRCRSPFELLKWRSPHGAGEASGEAVEDPPPPQGRAGPGGADEP